MRAFLLSAALTLSVAACASAGAAPEHAAGGAGQAVQGEATAALARRLLPPALAARVVAHEAQPASFPAPASFSFYTKPKAFPDGTCRRERHYVSVPASGEASAVASSTQVALAAGCALREGGMFANLDTWRDFDGSVAALHRLAALRAAAAAPGDLPFQLSCRTFKEPSACAQSARSVLAGLPLNKVFSVGRDYDGVRWRAGVVPDAGPGKPYWNVVWSEDGGERPTAVSLSWEIPAPF